MGIFGETLKRLRLGCGSVIKHVLSTCEALALIAILKRKHIVLVSVAGFLLKNGLVSWCQDLEKRFFCHSAIFRLEGGQQRAGRAGEADPETFLSGVWSRFDSLVVEMGTLSRTSEMSEKPRGKQIRKWIAWRGRCLMCPSALPRIC